MPLARGGTSQRINSCTELLEALGGLGLPAPDDIVTCARKLDLHYVDSRYPNGVGGAPDKFYDKAIAGEAMACCESIRAFAGRHLR